jgi:hypothetical protein
MKPVDIDAVLNGYYERKRAKVTTLPAEIVDYGLLCRYAAGDLDAAERAQAEQLVACNPSLKELVACLRDADQEREPLRLPARKAAAPFVLARLWSIPRMQLVRCAALLVMLAGVSMVIWQQRPNQAPLFGSNDAQPPVLVVRTRGICAPPEGTGQPPVSATNSARDASVTNAIDGTRTNL